MVAQTWENPGLGGRGPLSVACAPALCMKHLLPAHSDLRGDANILEKILPGVASHRTSSEAGGGE